MIEPIQNKVILKPLTEDDFEIAASLAVTIWRSHYVRIIGLDQINYMLAERNTGENFQTYLNSKQRWFYLLWVESKPVGYCSFSLTNTPGEMKLEQLYLAEEFRGRKLGSLMLRYVESGARKKNASTLTLQVNKLNVDSISIYKKSGFTVKEESKFDIGNGYFMDDYVMVKEL